MTDFDGGGADEEDVRLAHYEVEDGRFPADEAVFPGLGRRALLCSRPNAIWKSYRG